MFNDIRRTCKALISGKLHSHGGHNIIFKYGCMFRYFVLIVYTAFYMLEFSKLNSSG